jgi:hypothetical protein
MSVRETPVGQPATVPFPVPGSPFPNDGLPPTLVVLAAGLGSRYGGLKQLDPIGPGATTLMDYSVFDAHRAGFRRAVFIVRPDMGQVFEQYFLHRYRDHLEVLAVPQRLDDLPPGHSVPPGRSKPWGTTHALLAARDVLPGGFAVANADDFYGRESFELARGVLRGGDSRNAAVCFRLDHTMSPCGGVHRAVLEQSAEGALLQVLEVRDLARSPDGRFLGNVAGTPREFPGDTPVSMNLWALTPAILRRLGEAFDRFLSRAPADRDECYLPESLQEVISRGQATIDVVSTTSRWCGVTYPGDRQWASESLAELVRAGEYPERLWP